MKYDLANLQQALTNARKTRGITQGEVAERSGISQATVSAFESHQGYSRLDTFLRYAEAIGVTVMVDFKYNKITKIVATDDQFGQVTVEPEIVAEAPKKKRRLGGIARPDSLTRVAADSNG